MAKVAVSLLMSYNDSRKIGAAAGIMTRARAAVAVMAGRVAAAGMVAAAWAASCRSMISR